MSINLASRQSAITTDSYGITHLVWADDGYIWYAVYDNNSQTWENAEIVASTGIETVTSLNIVADEKLIDSDNPGLAVVWQQGSLNDSDFYYTAAQYDANADLQWLPEAQAITSDQVGDLEPTVIVDNGEVIVVGSKVNIDNVLNLSIKEDTDFYYQQFAIKSSQFTDSNNNSPEFIAPYSPQLITDGLVNLGVFENATQTSPSVQSGIEEGEDIAVDAQNALAGSKPFGALEGQIYFETKFDEDWKLLESLPDVGILLKILSPFMKNLNLNGTISGGETFNSQLQDSSISLKLNSKLQKKSPLSFTSPWKSTVYNNKTNKFVADDKGTIYGPGKTRTKTNVPISFGASLDSIYEFSENYPYDLESLKDVLGLTASVKIPIITPYDFAEDEFTLGLLTVNATGSFGVNFTLLAKPENEGGDYFPKTLGAALASLDTSDTGAGVLAIAFADGIDAEANSVAAVITSNVVSNFVSFLEGSSQGLDLSGFISFPVIGVGIEGIVAAPPPFPSLEKVEMSAGLNTALNWGLGDVDDTISLHFPMTFTYKIGPIGLSLSFNPGWVWDIHHKNADSQCDNSDVSNVSSENSLLDVNSSEIDSSGVSAQVVGSLVTLNLDAIPSSLPKPEDFTVTVTDIDGNSQNIPVFNVIQGNTSDSLVLQLESAIPVLENYDYRSNPQPITNPVTLSFTNNEGIKDNEGNVIADLSLIPVNNATPNSISAIYNPISGNSQNYINPNLLLDFNIPLDTSIIPDISRFTVTSLDSENPLPSSAITKVEMSEEGVMLVFDDSVSNQSLQNVTVSYKDDSGLGDSLTDSDGKVFNSFTVNNGIFTQVSQSTVFITDVNLALDFSDSTSDYTLTVTDAEGNPISENITVNSATLVTDGVILVVNQTISPEQNLLVNYQNQTIQTNSFVSAITPPGVNTESALANVEANLGQESDLSLSFTKTGQILATWVSETPPLGAIASYHDREIITLYFADDLGTTPPSPEQFTVTDNNKNTYSVSNVGISQNSVTLSLSQTPPENSTLSVSYQLTSNGDNSENLYIENSETQTKLWIPSFSNYSVTNAVDTINAPTLIDAVSNVESATVNNIILIFDQPLTGNPISSQFTIESNGVEYIIEPNIAPVKDSNTVTLKVELPTGGSLIGSGDLVTVSYNPSNASEQQLLIGEGGEVEPFFTTQVFTSVGVPTNVIKYAFSPSGDSLLSNVTSIPGTQGLNFYPVSALDSLGNNVVVWAYADSSDINTNLTPGEFYTDDQTQIINESLSKSDVYYSIYNASTQEWSIASPIAQQEGTEGAIALGIGANGNLMAAWLNYNNGKNNIYWSSLSYDNNGQPSWSDPQILYVDASPDPLTELSIHTVDGKPTVFWTETQRTSYSELTVNESPLLYYRLAETSGTTLINEGIYGAGGNGTYSGSVTFNQIGALENTTTNQGDPNPAILFNSGNSANSAQIPLSSSNSYALEFWFKVPEFPSDSLNLVSADGLFAVSLNNSNLSVNISNNNLNSQGVTFDANQWYYVIVTYDGGNQTANLYVNGDNVGSIDNLDFTLPTNTTLTLANSSNSNSVYLDEIALYDRALISGDSNNSSDTNTENNSTNLTGSQLLESMFAVDEISNKYNSRYADPLASGPDTYYVTYDGNSWGLPSFIEPTYKPVATVLSDSNKTAYDVTSAIPSNSNSSVNPNGKPDIFLSVNLGNQQTGVKITSIEVTTTDSKGDNFTWTAGKTGGNQLAVLQGNQLLNPINPNDSFEYTILGKSVDLDLFLDAGDNTFDSSTKFNVTINYSVGNPSTQTLEQSDVTSEPTTVNPDQVLGIATVTEANDSSLSLIDSGFVINNTSPSMGYVITSADFNNDGKSDVAIGNRGYTDTSGNLLGQGSIQILFGGDNVLLDEENNPLTPKDLTGNPKGVLIINIDDQGQANGDYAFSLATGDVDGDGKEDLVIGNPNANNQQGIVYVVLGKSMTDWATIDVSQSGDWGYTITPNQDTLNSSTNQKTLFGYSVAVGNFNSSANSNGTYATGTKYDIAIGSPGANNNNGAVYVAFDGSSDYYPVYNSQNKGELAGYSVTVSPRTANSVTFTGNKTSDDLIIGAMGYSADVTNQWNGLSGLPTDSTQNPCGSSAYPSTSPAEIGAVYVYQSNGTETLTEYASYTGSNLPSSDNGTASNQNAGTALSSDDWDGDNINDLAISAPGGATYDGLIYVLKGGVNQNSSPQNLDHVANLAIFGGVSYSETGSVITSAGDVNGDKYEDFLITAPKAVNGTGQGYVLFGPLDLKEVGKVFDLNVTANDSKKTFLLNGDRPSQLVGTAVSGIGDINNDGVDDLMISAPNALQTYAVYGHQWLADDGSIKLADLSGDNGFVIDGDLYRVKGTQTNTITSEGLGSALLSNNGTLYLAYADYLSDVTSLNLITSEDGGTTWSDPVLIAGGESDPEFVLTSNNLSLAVYKGVLYVAYTTGNGGNLNIAYSENSGQSWDQVNGYSVQSDSGYSLVEYEGELMAFFTNADNRNISYITSSNPQGINEWSSIYTVNNPDKVGGIQTAYGELSPTVLNNTLYLAYRGEYNNQATNNYYVTETNGTDLTNLSWEVSEVSNISNPNTAPSLTNDGSTLYLTYADNTNQIYTTTSEDGSNWATPQATSNQSTNANLSSTVLNKGLYLTYQGTDSNLYVTALDAEIPLSSGNGSNVVMLGDINGDGFADVLSGGSQKGAIIIFGNSTTNLLDAAVGSDDLIVSLPDGKLIQKVISAGDINGDGLQDFALIDTNNNFYIQLGADNLDNLGTLILSNPTTVLYVDQGINFFEDAIALGDYNGDGYDDMALLYTPQGEDDKYWLLSYGNDKGNLNGVGYYDDTSELVANGLGDINGDGYDEFGFGNPQQNFIDEGANKANGQFTVYLGDDQGNVVINPPDAEFSQAIVNNDWTNQDNIPIANQYSKLAPTLVEFNGYLYMVYNSNTDDTLWMQRSVDGVNWESLSNLGSDFETNYQPSLAVFDGTLYLAFTAINNSELILASAVTDDSDLGLTFNKNQGVFYQIAGNVSSNGPTLVSYNDQLYTFFLANNNNDQKILYVTSNDPQNSSSWSANNVIPNQDNVDNRSSDRIGAAVFQDDLYIAFKGSDNTSINVNYSSDGENWQSNNQILANQSTTSGPSLVAVDDTIYLFYKSSASDQSIYYTYGDNWSSIERIPNQSSYDRTSPVLFNQSVYLAHVGYETNAGTDQPEYDQRIYVTTSNPIYEANQAQQLGSQLEGIGDFNGDGIEDYGILAPGYASLRVFNSDDFNNNQGALFIYYGTTSGTLNQNPDVVLNPKYDGSKYPTVYELSNFSAIGDINGDGYDDVAIASPSTSLNSNNTKDGAVFVVFGGSNWGNTYNATNPFDLNQLTKNQANSDTNNSSANGFLINGLPSSEAGISLSGGEDVNGDSFDDFIIGAPGDNDNLTYVIFGSDFNNTVTQTGTIGDDVMIGTPTGESFLGDQGDDIIYTNGGLDVVYASLGDDFVTVNDTYFRRLDGGTGTDVLVFEGYNGQDWDLTKLSPDSRIRNFEILVTENYGANTLTLNSLTVNQLSENNTVTVIMDEEDTLNLSSDFSLNGTVYQYNQKFDRYSFGSATVLLNRIVDNNGNNLITVTKNAPATNNPQPIFPNENITTESVKSDGENSQQTQNVTNSIFTANDENAPTRLSVSNPIANEADGKVEFTIQRTGNLDKYVEVSYLTQDGRAKSGTDYNPVVGKAIFTPGENTVTVSVPLILDDVYTGTKDFGLLVTLEEESLNPLTDEFHLYVDPSGGQIRNLEFIDSDRALSVMNGELEYRVMTTEGKVDVKLYCEGDRTFNSYYIFNNQTQTYEVFEFDGDIGAELFDEDSDGKYEGAILHLQDGSEHDLDGVENGIILKRGFFAEGDAPQITLNQPLYRFRNTNYDTGVYLYAGEAESQSIRENYSNFVEEGLAFYVSTTPQDGLTAFNRFQNANLPGTYLYAGETESESIRENYPNFVEEGIAFYAYPQGSQMANSISRFQNSSLPSTYLYTSQPETDSVISNYPNFHLEGIAFGAIVV